MAVRSVLLMLAIVAAGCRPPAPVHEYRLIGQVLRVDAAASRVTIRHQDIEGFMPGMTMAFPVKDERVARAAKAGDLIEGTLSVQGGDVWISRLRVTGAAALPELPPLGLGPGDLVADAMLVDQDARAMRIGDLRGHASLVTFIYTRCPLPEYCPTIESRLASLQDAIRKEPALSGTRIVAITLDPAHDTPKVLAEHAAARGADPRIWRFATGEAAAIDAFGRQFGLGVTRTSAEPSGIEHNLRTIVLSPDLHVVAVLTGADWQTPDALEPLRAAAHSGDLPTPAPRS